jgi:hypothetical protein
MNSIQRPFSLCAVAALSLIVILSDSASVLAGTISSNQLPSIMMTVASSPTEWDYSPPQTAYVATPDGYALSYEQHAYGVCDNTANVTVRELEFNPDPFVLNNILVTNTTTTTQIYSVTVGLPTSFPAPNLIAGNITTSVIDGGSGSATISTASPDPIYQAQIDGSTVETLQDDPFSITTSISSGSSASFGFDPSAIPVVSSIGIKLTFQLTAGDTAAIISRFDVVPEPSCLALCGIALAFGVAAGRRNRSR